MNIPIINIQHQLNERLTLIRDNWKLLRNPEKIQIPTRVRSWIIDYVNETKQNKTNRNDWVYEENIKHHTTLNHYELEGEECSLRNEMYEVIEDRLYPKQFDPNDKSRIFNRYSVLLKTKMFSYAFEMYERDIPEDIIPKKDDSKQTLCFRLGNNPYLDEQYKKGSDVSYNFDVTSRQCVRRTFSNVTRGMQKIEDQDMRCEEEKNRETVELFVYPCYESPVPRYMCRPTRRIENCMLVLSWLITWPYLSEESRRCPPNGGQLVIYHKKLKRRMGRHRDNSNTKCLQNVLLGNDPIPDNRSYSGVQNSQVTGTNVLIYTLGNAPMMMEFSYPDPNNGLGQKRCKYIRWSCKSFRCGSGCIAVLDPLDDLLFCHEIKFMNLKLERLLYVDGNSNIIQDIKWRGALVMRWLSNRQEFFKDTSTMRLDCKMINRWKKSKAKGKSNHLVRYCDGGRPMI